MEAFAVLLEVKTKSKFKMAFQNRKYFQYNCRLDAQGVKVKTRRQKLRLRPALQG